MLTSAGLFALSQSGVFALIVITPSISLFASDYQISKLELLWMCLFLFVALMFGLFIVFLILNQFGKRREIPSKVLWSLLNLFWLAGPVSQNKMGIVTIVAMGALFAVTTTLFLLPQSRIKFTVLLFSSSVLSFLLAITVADLPFSNQKPPSSTERSAQTQPNPRRPDILWIVADEVSGAMIFDEDAKVRSLFPNLRTLQTRAVTYSQTYAVGARTDIALPGMILGEVPDDVSYRDLLLVSRHEIKSLKDELGLVVISPLYPEVKSAKRFQLHLYDFVAVVGRHALSRAVQDWFPDTSSQLNNFWRLDLGSQSSLDSESAIKSVTTVLDKSDNPTFIMWHSLVAHVPYSFDIFGKRMPSSYLGMSSGGLLVAENLEEAHRRLALAAAVELDRQIGQVLSTLQSSVRDRDIMIVFSADHGRSFDTSHFREGGSISSRWGEIGRVPLLIQYPDQESRIETNS